MKIENIITGKSTEHLEHFQDALVHSKIIPSLSKLQSAAHAEGFELAIASAHRGFERQLQIWNAKACGKQKLLDHNEQEINFENLNSQELLFAILRWSALPGASRHHWGSDLDIYDAKKIEAQHLQLTQKEAQQTFGEFHQWLDQNLQHFDFYRPYHQDQGGVAPEPWHISYQPLAQEFQNKVTKELIADTIKTAPILLKEDILTHLDTIFEVFIQV